jgi:hypothetical protein
MWRCHKNTLYSTPPWSLSCKGNKFWLYLCFCFGSLPLNGWLFIYLLLLFLKGGTKRHPQAPNPHGSAFYSKPNGPTSPYGCTVPSLVGNACLSVTLYAFSLKAGSPFFLLNSCDALFLEWVYIRPRCACECDYDSW